VVAAVVVLAAVLVAVVVPAAVAVALSVPVSVLAVSVPLWALLGVAVVAAGVLVALVAAAVWVMVSDLVGSLRCCVVRIGVLRPLVCVSCSLGLVVGFRLLVRRYDMTIAHWRA
jgi:hypothetical protein